VIFVDSGAWFASVIATDPDHAAAAAWLASKREALLTTDYVLDETLTLLRARGQSHIAVALGAALVAESLAVLHFCTKDELLLAWDTFQQYSDKEWSFTDCLSKVVMERLAIHKAFAFDQHFRQFGTVSVVP
jgi:predicted nucleic acid-binding protein